MTIQTPDRKRPPRGEELPDRAPAREDMIKQETRKNPIMAFWFLNSPPLHFSGFHGFLLKLYFR
jgi:hypothetical protein